MPPSTMQALQLTRQDPSSPPTLTLTTLPIPQPKSPNEILVQIKAAALLPSDQLNRAGNFPSTTYPRVTGRDFAGTVVSGGSGALVGKDVFGTSGDILGFSRDGTHAQYLVVPEEGIAIKPESISFVQAAGLGTPYTTAKLAIDRARAASGDTVLVLGSHGSVGAAATKISKALGFKTITGARGVGKADIDTAGDSSLSGVRKLTDGKGADVVIDAVGNDKLMEAALDVLAINGRYSVFAAAQMPDGKCTVNMKNLYRLEQTIVGASSSEQKIGVMGKMCQDIAQLIEAGKLAAQLESAFEIISLQEAQMVFDGKKEKRGAKWIITP